MSEKENDKPTIPNYKLVSLFGAISYVLFFVLHIICQLNDGVYRADRQTVMDVILPVVKCHGIILTIALAVASAIMALILAGVFGTDMKGDKNQ